MNRNSILVLGAGAYQVPLINAIHRMGYQAIVASIPGNYPGFRLADVIEHVDTRDKKQLLAVAKKHKIAAVITAGTDVAVSAMGYINDNLGLAGITGKTAKLVSNKIDMKEALIKGRVNTAKYETLPVNCGVDHLTTCLENRIGYPAIVKAVDSSGSRGITKVISRNDIAAAYNEMRKVTRHTHFVVEEYLVGIEFGAQLFVEDSRLGLFMPHGDYLFESNGITVPFGHYVPYGDKTLHIKLKDQAERLIEALGVSSGAVNVDAMLCDGDVYILEAGARAGATGLPELVSLKYGFDYYEAIISASLGKPVSIGSERDDVFPVAMLIGSSVSGRVANIAKPDPLPAEVVELTIDFTEGDLIRRFNVGPDRLGIVIASGKSISDSENIINETISKLICKLDNGSKVTWAQGHL